MAKRGSRSARLRRQTRQQHVKTMLFGLLFAVVAVTAGILAVTVFFKVQTIEMVGDTRYSAEELEAVLGVQPGDNLFLWGQSSGIQAVEAQFPYVDTMKVHRKLPDRLILEVAECTPIGVLQTGNKNWLIDVNGKLLEEVDAQTAQSYRTITGVTLSTSKTAGQVLETSESDSVTALLTLLQVLRQSDRMERVNFINLSRLYEIHMGYDGKFDVWLGTLDALAHKLKFLDTIIDEKLSPSDIGVIDISDDTSARFRPDTAENVASAAAQNAEMGASGQTAESVGEGGVSS